MGATDTPSEPAEPEQEQESAESESESGPAEGEIDELEFVSTRPARRVSGQPVMEVDMRYLRELQDGPITREQARHICQRAIRSELQHPVKRAVIESHHRKLPMLPEFVDWDSSRLMHRRGGVWAVRLAFDVPKTSSGASPDSSGG